MRRKPASTAAAILTLALGISASVSMFSLLEASLLRRLPYHDPHNLCMLWTAEAGSHRGMNSTFFDFRDWVAETRTFERMAAFRPISLTLSDAEGSEQVGGVESTPGLLETLGVTPILGRALGPEDQGGVLFGHALWVRRFGGDRAILGRNVRISGTPHVVLGVLPPGFYFPPVRFAGRTDILVRHRPQLDRTGHYLQVIGRLKPGVALTAARADMGRVAAALDALHEERGEGILVDPIGQYTSAIVKETPLLLFGAVMFLLLIACVNVVNLLLYRAADRRQELAIRAALGASQGRLLRQMLTETGLLSGAGALLGLLLTSWMLPLLLRLAPERTALFTRLRDTGVHVNGPVLIFALVLALLVAVITGIPPAWRSARRAGDLSRSQHIGALRAGLLVTEVALSFMLLVGTGLLIRSVWRLTAVDPGFRTDGLLTLAVGLPTTNYPNNTARNAFIGRMLSRLSSLPGVVSAAAASDLPLTHGGATNSFEIEGWPGRQLTARFHAVSPGYLQTIGVPLVRGRYLDNADGRSGALVAVVSHAMASRYWAGEDPIGRAILTKRAFVDVTSEGRQLRFEPQRVEIVGVVGDLRQVGLDVPPGAELFMPLEARPSDSLTVVLRTGVPPATVGPAVAREIWKIDADQPVSDLKTMGEWVTEDLGPRRFVLLLIGFFACTGLILASSGIYGVVSYAVARRTREIGIRVALGASRRDVAWWVARSTVIWIAAGTAIGLAGAAGVGRLLANYLYDVTPTDTATLLAVAITLAACGLLATVDPIRRALRVNPAVALRAE
jgi:putative ABC transport system permease protein